MGLCGSAQGRVEADGGAAGHGVVPKSAPSPAPQQDDDAKQDAGGGGGKAGNSSASGGEQAQAEGGGSNSTEKKSQRRSGSTVQPPSADELGKMQIQDVFLGFNVAYNELNLKKTIGRGSYGEVWECEFRGINCACKKLHENGDQNESIYDFYHEISIMGNLKHPNILHFFGACSSDPHYCILTELMCGSVSDILSLAHKKRLDITWKLVTKIADDCAEACKYLHAREPKIVHRDLKSENLLIDDHFTAKVSDFGLSRFIDLDAKMTVCGTPSWVAPEIFREERYTEKVDVYSYAILLWELITQDKPHYGFDAIQLPYLVGKEKLRPAVPEGCLSKVRTLLELCWHENPEKRPSFEEICKMVKKLLKERGGDIDGEMIVVTQTNRRRETAEEALRRAKKEAAKPREGLEDVDAEQ